MGEGEEEEGPQQRDRWTDLQHFQRLRGVQDAGLRLGVAGLVPSAGREPALRCVRSSARRRQGWGDSPPPPNDNDRSDSLPPPSSGMATMAICLPEPEPGTGRVRAREGPGGSKGTAQGGSGGLAALRCGGGGRPGGGKRGSPPPPAPVSGSRAAGRTGPVRPAPPGLPFPPRRLRSPVSMEPGGGCHGDQRATASQSAWSCGSSSPPGWRQGGRRRPGTRTAPPPPPGRRGPRAPRAGDPPQPRLFQARLRGDVPWGPASFRLVPEPPRIQGGMLRERRGRAARKEGAAPVGGRREAAPRHGAPQCLGRTRTLTRGAGRAGRC